MRSASVHALLTGLFLLSAGACARTDVFAGDATLTLTPPTATVELSRSVQFAATVVRGRQAAAVAQVTWSVEPAGRGNITAQGVYTAPALFPDPEDASEEISVRATLVGHAAVTVFARVTLVPAQGGPAVDLLKIAGDGRLVAAGLPLTESLVVKAVDAEGRGTAGLAVAFASPDLSFGSVEAVTDAAGFARGTPNAGTLAGPALFPVTAEGLSPVAFELVVKPGAIETLTATHPNPRGQRGTTLAQPLSLRFADGFGNPIAGATATVTARDGGSAAPLEAVSDAAGLQRYSITLGERPGPQTFGFVFQERVRTSLDFLATGGAAARLELVDGDNQTGVVASALAAPLRVRVLDAEGIPAESATLAWTTTRGVLSDVETALDANGLASALLTLPTQAGFVRVTVDAGALNGSPLSFSALASAGPAARLTLVSGGGQSTTAGQLFGGAFAVRVSDAHSNPVAGTPVSFSVLEGGGDVAFPTVDSGTDGLAQAALQAGPAAGPQRYRATAPGLFGAPIDVFNVAIAPTALLLEIVRGNNQTGRVQTDLPQPFVVRVRQGAVPVPNRAVTFAVALGDGSIRPAVSTTISDGTAAATARLGALPGRQRFSASVAGAQNSPLFFEVTATGRVVALLRVVAGNGQIAAPGAVLPAPLVVEALDETGAVIEGADLAFSAAAGSVTPPAAVTDANGRATATATLGPDAGEQLFTATAGAAAVTFRATAMVPGAGRRLTIVRGDGQSGEVGLVLGPPLVVRVVDSSGLPVAGVPIRWRAEAELAAVVEVDTEATNPDGQVRAIVRLGKPIGAQRFFAEADVAGSPVTFLATATAAPAERVIAVDGDGQSALAGAALPRALVARVIDRVGNPISGHSVTFRPATGSGSVTPAAAQATAATGEVSATVVLGTALGAQTYTATGTGLQTPPAVFTATATNAVERISVGPQAQLAQVGASLRYSAVAIYTDGSSSDVTEQAVWLSTSPSAASVSDAAGSKGIAYANGAGTTTLRASFGGQRGETTLRVEAATLRSLVILPADPTIVRGSVRAFRVTGTYSNNAVADLTERATWTSSALAIATVSDVAGSKGLVRGTGAGVATITATVGTISTTRLVTVSQAPLTFLEITPASIVQPAGTAATFRATATYEDGTVEDVTAVALWSSSDPLLMTLQNAPAVPGRATFLAQGTPEAVATFGGRTARQRVTITGATVVSLLLFPDELDLAVRDFVQYRLLATYSDGTVTDAAQLATWSSSAPAVADVGNQTAGRGVVTGIAAGDAVVTARIGAATATGSVRVNNAAVQRMQVMATNGDRCPVGGLLALRVLALYTNGDRLDITDQASWSSSDPTVAVTGNGPIQGGFVQCLAEGRVTITAAWNNQSALLQVTVTPAVLTAITLAPASAQLARGDTRQFFATGQYSQGPPRELTYLVTWTSSNPAVVTVSNAPGSRGSVVAIAAGTATITATLDGVSQSAALTVTNALLQLIVVSPANPVVGRREQFVQFSAIAVYDDTTTQDVTDQAAWTSANASVAIVSNDQSQVGIVILTGTGTSLITATYGGKHGQSTLTVR